MSTSPTSPANTILKVSATSEPVRLAGAIAACVRQSGEAEMQAIGAAAVNQAVKAVAISRGYLAPVGIDVAVLPTFISVAVEATGQEVTGLRLVVVQVGG